MSERYIAILDWVSVIYKPVRQRVVPSIAYSPGMPGGNNHRFLGQGRSKLLRNPSRRRRLIPMVQLSGPSPTWTSPTVRQDAGYLSASGAIQLRSPTATASVHHGSRSCCSRAQSPARVRACHRRKPGTSPHASSRTTAARSIKQESGSCPISSRHPPVSHSIGCETTPARTMFMSM